MRWIALALVGVLAACGGPEDGAGGDGNPFPAAQKIIDDVAAAHPNIQRLTLHATPKDAEGLTQVASTMAERRGKPSDPEDFKAMKTGKEIVLDEEGAIDVTIPILLKDGVPTAVAGVTLKLAEGADNAKLVEEARAIAKELEAAVQGAAKAPWWNPRRAQ